MDVGKVKITKIAERVGVDDGGKARREVVVTYTVGAHGPFAEAFPGSPFDPVAANQRLAEFARALGQLNSEV